MGAQEDTQAIPYYCVVHLENDVLGLGQGTEMEKGRKMRRTLEGSKIERLGREEWEQS